MLTGYSTTEMDSIKSIPLSNFHLKDLGVLKYFLRLDLAYSDQGISLYQWKYCLDLLQESGLLGSKLVSALMDYALRLRHDSRPVYPDALAYRRLVGCLLYLTTTCPNIAFATHH